MDRRSMLGDGAVVGVAAMATGQRPTNRNRRSRRATQARSKCSSSSTMAAHTVVTSDLLLEKWVAALPGRRVQARTSHWGNAQLKELARFYYTLEVTGEVRAVQQGLYRPAGDKGAAQYRGWCGPGSPKQGATKALHGDPTSPSVSSRWSSAPTRSPVPTRYRVPTLAIDGKYRPRDRWPAPTRMRSRSPTS